MLDLLLSPRGEIGRLRLLLGYGVMCAVTIGVCLAAVAAAQLALAIGVQGGPGAAMMVNLARNALIAR